VVSTIRGRSERIRIIRSRHTKYQGSTDNPDLRHVDMDGDGFELVEGKLAPANPNTGVSLGELCDSFLEGYFP